MAINLGSAYGKVEIDGSGVARGINNAVSSMQRMATMGEKLGEGMQKAGQRMTLGLTLPILAFGYQAVKSAGEAEAALADLNAVLLSTNGIAGVTAQSVQDYASEMQMLTKFSDEEIISGAAMLLTFTKIGKETFPEASDAALDMAQKFGMDLPQAAITLGKALNDPISGVTALRRIGVMLTDEQEKSIKAFMDVNDIASAQAVILKELKTEVGGAAEAFGQTFPGQVAKFKNRLDEVYETIGKQLIPALLRLMYAARPFLNWIENASPATIDFIVAILGIVAAAGPVTYAIGTIIKVATGLKAVYAFIQLTAIPTTWAWVAANAAVIWPILLIIATLYLLWKAYDTNFGGIRTTIEQLTFILGYNVNKWVNWFKGIETTAKQLWFIIKWAFSGIGAAIDSIGPKIKEFAASLGLIKLPKDLTPGSPTPFENGLNGIADAMGNVSEASGKMASSIAADGLENRENIQASLQMQLDFFGSYFKNIDGLMNQNTKNQNAAMKAQAQATKQSLEAQAAALKKYQEAAAQFYSGRGIPTSGSTGMSQAQSMQMAARSFRSPNELPNFSSIPVEQLNSVNVEQARPVTVEVIQNFSNGVTMEQARSIVRENQDEIFNAVSQAMGGR